MKRKAQLSGTLITWIIVILIVAMSLVFGYNAINKVTQTGDLAESTIFEKKIKADIFYMYSQPGSVIEETYSLPETMANKVYFVDPEELVKLKNELDIVEPDTMKEIIASALEILDEAIDKTGNNMFFYKDGELVKAEKVDNVYVGFPYFQCFKPFNGKIEMYLEGYQGKTELDHKQERFNCGPMIIEAGTDDDIKKIAEEAIDENWINDEGDTQGQNLLGNDPNIIVQKVKNTAPQVEMARIVNVKEDKETTRVDIIVKAKKDAVTNFIYLENLDKDGCIDNLYGPGGPFAPTEDCFSYGVECGEQALIYLDLDLGAIDFRWVEDPQLMWDFGSGVVQTQHIKYDLKKVLGEDCKELLRGIGFSMD